MPDLGLLFPSPDSGLSAWLRDPVAAAKAGAPFSGTGAVPVTVGPSRVLVTKLRARWVRCLALPSRTKADLGYDRVTEPSQR